MTNEMSAFERQLSRVVQSAAPPAQPVDVSAVVRRAAIEASPAWRLQTMFNTTKLLVAGAIVALAGAFLLNGALTRVQNQESASRIGAPASQPASPEVATGTYTISWGIGDAIHLTVPVGWWQSDDGASICKRTGEGDCPQGGGVNLTLHDVSRVARDVCRPDSAVFPEPHFDDVGGSVGELAWVLGHQAGTQVTSADDITLGGYPAKRLVVTLPTGACPDGPEGRYLWQDATGPGFEILPGVTGRIYLIDVDGLPLVITSS